MLNLRGENLNYLINGLSSEDKPSISTINLEDLNIQATLEDLSQKHFSSIVLTSYTPIKTLVPEGVYVSSHQQEYLEFNYGKKLINSKGNSDYLQSIESHLVYQDIPNLKKLYELFPSLRVKHTTSILIESQLKSSVASQNTEVTVYCEKDNIDIIICNRNELKFCNSFKVFNPEDFTYYIVYVMDLMGLSTKDTKVRICGLPINGGLDLLKKYCSHAGFHRFNFDKHIGKDLSIKEYSENIILLNQYQCG